MHTEVLSFTSAAGAALSARLDLPADGRVAAYAVFAHCFTCGKNLRSARNVSLALAAQRIAVLRFDFAGLGESEGDFGRHGLSSNVADLVAAAEVLAQRFEAPRILVGHSFGGTAVLHAAAHIPSVRAVATIGAPFDPRHVLQHLGAAQGRIEQEGEAEVAIGGRPFRLTRRFLEEMEGADPAQVVHGLGRALLVFHSPVDAVVDVDNAARIFQAALHPKSFVSLDHADHLLTDDADSCYVGTVTAAWARKYVERPAEAADAPPQEHNRVVARGESTGYRTHIMVRGHAFTADEPVSAGGTDTGPNPYDLLLAGLGACTSMTLRMYADRKGWALQGPVVRLTHDKIHAADCPECDQSQPRIDRITRELELPGELTGEQRQRLLEIADRCPVHRTLESKVLIRTSLRD